MTYREVYMRDIIDEARLSARATNILKVMETVKTLEDFMALTEQEVRSRKGAGAGTWHEIRDAQDRFAGVLPQKTATFALRDQAALAALPAVIQVCAGDRPREIGTETHEQMFARKAWAVADAFIAAREGETDG